MGTGSQDGATGLPASDVITASAFTLIVAFYAEVIDNPATTGFEADAIIALANLKAGLTTADASGVKKLRGYNNDGAEQIIEVTIAESQTWIAVFQHASGQLKLSVIDESGSETAASDVASGDTADLTVGSLFGGQSGGIRTNVRMGELAIWNAALAGTDLTNAKDYFKAAWLPGVAIPVVHHHRQRNF